MPRPLAAAASAATIGGVRYLSTILAALLWTSQAWGFAAPVHRMLSERSLRRQVQVQTMANPTDQGLVDFWIWLGGVFAMDSSEHRMDGVDPERFRNRYKVGAK